ncbi:MAG TPA: hypothetical protein VI197_29630 [Polyangiaceae bacterium]
MLLGTANWGRAQSTVSGPESAGSAVETQLPGPSTRALKDAVELHFDGDCLTPAGVVRAVARNWTASDRVDRRVSVFIAGEQHPKLWVRYSVQVEGDPDWTSDNAREFTGVDDCARLEEILGLSLAMVIERVPPPAAEPKPKPRPAPARPKRAAPIPLPRGMLGAQAIGAVGVFPTGAVGLGLRGEHSIDQFAARLGAGYLVEGSELSSEGFGAPGMLTGLLGACYGSLGRDAIGKMCLDAWFGMLLPDADSQTEGMWFALAPGADVGIRVSRSLAVRVGTQLSFNLVRVRSESGFDSEGLLSDRSGASLLGWILTLGLDWQVL